VKRVLVLACLAAIFAGLVLFEVTDTKATTASNT